jgi:putative spermidine/putrescine transport system substrate-binding protein
MTGCSREHRRLAGLYRTGRDRQGLRLGDQVRGKASGCKVNVKTANTSDEMVALMNEGGFDLVTASGDASLRLVAGDRVQPINTDLIPSWKTVDDRLQDAPWHTVDGVHYGVPYMWGPNVLMYNTEVFKEAPTILVVVFEEQTLPDGKSNKGRVQAYDGPIHIADAAQYLMAHKPELGITSPYELNEDQYKAALDLLRGAAQLVSRYWHDAFIQIDDFKNEGVVASGSWPFQVNLLKADGQPMASTIPEEGATGWADTTMMHVDAKNPTCAYLWMEHTLPRTCNPTLRSGSGRTRRFRRPAPTGRACRRRKAAPRTGWTISTRSGSGPRRCRTARWVRGPACPITAGSATTSA